MQQQHGSGKTAVLVERIINKVVNDGIDIDKILVVTFTNAAASEMRERILDAIYKKIEENPNDIKMQRQLNLINKASICTIHSFCLDVIRNNFYELNISANFRVADSTEIEMIKQEALEEIFEEKYLNEDEDFLKLIDMYTGYRDDEPLKDIILNIYRYICSSPFPTQWLDEKIQMLNQKSDNFAESIWGNIIIKEVKDELEDNILKLTNLSNKIKLYDELDKYTNVIYDDISQIEWIIKSIDDWDTTINRYNDLKFSKWPVDKKITIEMKEIAKNTRDAVKKSIKSIMDTHYIYTSDEVYDDINKMGKALEFIKKIIIEFMDVYAKKKLEKNIVDFTDIEHFALNILVKKDKDGKIQSSEVCKKYQNKYEEIAIDEYQDSNLVQEYILTSVSRGNNIFMVGDVKQSIYKFRQARPELFLEKYNTYKLKENLSEKDNLKIQLFKNFRSRDNILDITNTIFENIMSNSLGDIDYNKNEYLYLGANFEESKEDLIKGKTDINIIDLKQDEENDEGDFEQIENLQIEAKFVAKKIKELIESKKKVFDRKKGYREITYKDIVVLLRSTSKSAPIFEEEIAALNIPIYSDTSSEYLNSIEIQTIMSLLRIIENPVQDIPLVTVLRSMIGGFTDNELVEIRLADKNTSFYYAMKKSMIKVNDNLRNKIEVFLEKLAKWRNEEKYKSLDELIWQIYIETGYYNYVTLMTNGIQRQANLKMLFEKAKKYESESFKGLYNFINFIDKLQLSNNDMGAAKIIGENDNVVRIMSIHKSKGLEFPVVFLSQTGKGFNMQDLNDPILLHQDLGFGPKFIDEKRRIEYNTLAKEAIKIQSKKESISEEMRILYVALTRAKEKLIITGISKDANNDISKKEDLIEIYGAKEEKINPKLVSKYKTYLDWIELVYLYNKSKMDELVTFNVINKNEVLKEKEANIETLILDKFMEKRDIEKISKVLEWKYQNEISANIPVKTSVTKIKQLATNDYYEKEFDIPKFMKEEKVSNARRGTLMHLCIQKLDYNTKYSYDKIKEMVENLYKADIISNLEKESINIKKLYEYTKSNLFIELSGAKEIYKEAPFYINLSAKEAGIDDSDDKILVQGIIDLYYINSEDEVILVDFKTDYAENGNQLVEKYKTQLELYKIALEKSLDKKVSKMIIYSLYLNKEIIL